VTIGHINRPCPMCSQPLMRDGMSSDTSGMNVVCDDCLRPLCLRLARAIERGGGSPQVRIVDFQRSVHAGGDYYRIFIELPLLRWDDA